LIEPDELGASDRLAQLAVYLGQRPLPGAERAAVEIRIAGSRYDLGVLLYACCEKIPKAPRL
jgi:hypothetical protein